jgi:hypothetical protein
MPQSLVAGPGDAIDPKLTFSAPYSEPLAIR